jgi:hypothetical protein
MTRTEQKRLLRTFTRQVTDHLLAQSERWPEDWDGHDLRELAVLAFTHERTGLMRESARRRRAVANATAVLDLY